MLGSIEGVTDALLDSCKVGSTDGLAVGTIDGDVVGEWLGVFVEAIVGSKESEGVGLADGFSTAMLFVGCSLGTVLGK